MILLLLGELFADFVFFNVLVFAKNETFVSSGNLLKNFRKTQWKGSRGFSEKSFSGFSFQKQILIIINDTNYLRMNVLVKTNT